MLSNVDNDLQAYFTDVEHLRTLFRQTLTAPELARPLLVIHGVGGIGKSSLLRMFRLYCKRENVPVGLASGDEAEAKSVSGILENWLGDLQADKMTLPGFAKTLEHYRKTQAKVSEQARQAQEAREKAAESIGKTAAKVIVKGVLGAIPVVGGLAGELTGELGGAGAESLIDWLRGQGFAKADIDMLLDPTKKLTEDFLGEAAKVAAKRRFVLMLDTLEQISALEDWVCDFAQRLPPNILFVVAGRALPNWSRPWPSWMAHAEVHELKPMSEAVMRDLVQRYYATMRGGEPSLTQVEAILRFARGLPMVVTSAVQLWVKYGVEDFQAVKAEIVANLVDRLMEGVPHELIPVLEAAASVRWFDQPILRAVTGREDVREFYSELRRFPFVRTRVEGLALHDSIREMMDDNLRFQDSEHHSALHMRAAQYFEKKLAVAVGEEAERLGLERLYHRVRADEAAGLKVFQEIAEELAQYRLINRLRVLLNDVNTYPLEKENGKLWRSYYNARWMQLETQSKEAVETFAAIGENPQAEPKLRAYALCSLGDILSRWGRLGQPGSVERAMKTLEQSLSIVPIDLYLVGSISNLAHLYRYQGRWDEATAQEEKALQFFEAHGQPYELLHGYGRLKLHFASMGEWQKMFRAHQSGARILSAVPEHSNSRAEFLGIAAWAWIHMGRYAEAEKNVALGLAAAQQLDNIHMVRRYWMYLGLLYAVQDKYAEAARSFEESERISQTLSGDYEASAASNNCFWGILLTRQGNWTGAEEKLTQSLAACEKLKMSQNIQQVVVFLGQLFEFQHKWEAAAQWYSRSLEMRWTQRRNYESETLTGLMRVRQAQADYAALPALLQEAGPLAERYEYNDHLASQKLTQGHWAWETGRSGEVLPYYQQALIYALRHNHFLLDEVLAGRSECALLKPIIPYCLARGHLGKEVLGQLRTWWAEGVNATALAPLETISPIPARIPLLEAEKIARQREPGDGRPQTGVLQQLEAAL